MQLTSLIKMTDANSSDQSKKIINHIFMANSGWKIVYNIGDRYFIEDIIAYVFIHSGNSYELIPLTLPDIHLCQPLHEYMLKDGYVGLIDPQNELIINDYLEENQKILISKKLKKL